MTKKEKSWWKEAVVYQVYPRSFNDTTGNGIGDLRGIIEKLDYIKDLGVDVIWLNPVYESPCDDMGYDISNYRKILPQFGTMEDFDLLLSEMHKRGLKLVMDLVVNHTSDEHRWFVESRKSKDNPYRDYYIWKKPKADGSPPNNWVSYFGGSAWEYDEQTGEYYLHLFSKKQPDLNWENPKVREEVKDIMRFWLDKGVDGFRMDVIGFISKDPDFEDFPTDNPSGKDLGDKYANGPRLHEFLQELHDDVLSHYDCMTVGECPGVSPEDALLIVGKDRRELQTLFQFEGMDIDYGKNGSRFSIGNWDVHGFKKVYTKWHKKLYGKAWNSIYLMNHDQPRAVSRFGDDKKYRKESAKMLATFLLSMWGTPYIYQGEEIGMTNCPFEGVEEFRDIEMINYYNEQISKGKTKEEIMPGLLYRGRDNSRTPIQWNDSRNAVFSDAEETWIKVNPNYTEINVEEAEKDPDSILHYFRRMIKTRKDNDVLIYGDYELVDEGNDDVYAYRRFLDNEEMLVLLNFTDKETSCDVSPYNLEDKELIISNYKGGQKVKGTEVTLRPYEARIYKIK
ncbi:glycoside hydrolase family 13 protein [Halothermothrix orenii]|uniref:Alpha amylase catalytic region n=1 Tax=Halothermothrix orenii (strain H 168 / OCM 544 / DSM 9562) TaxID=373903 RepID=B8CWN3_HALOH|nr:alpha-glucosidase [Halothermothrix orenii]ACL69702.1 alpha amylase catalytic region [Halothermothrix orenii H 168]